jgi:hypothetical protein
VTNNLISTAGLTMTNRRQFIQSGLALSALSFTELAAMRTAVAGNQTSVPVLENFIYDSRYPESIDAARTIAAQGIALREIAGDLTDLWYGSYSEQWRQQPMTLAGVTALDALFVLETLAHDHGMRVIHKAVYPHKPLSTADDEQLYSWIIAPKESSESLGSE